MAYHNPYHFNGNELFFGVFFPLSLDTSIKIEIREKSKSNSQILRAIELTNQTGMVEWVDVDKEKLFGLFTRIPEREEISIPVEERLIVELYSK